MLKVYKPSKLLALGLAVLAIGCTPRSSGNERAARNADPPAPGSAGPANGQARAAGKRKIALLVGINAYKHVRPRLYGPANDIKDMRNLLTSPAYGFKNEDIRVLPDQEATRANILQAIDDHLMAKAEPGAVVVFYFSGHGAVCPNPADPTGKDNTIVPYDAGDPEGRDIRDKELNVRAQRLADAVGDTGGVTFILDSCHSGTAIKGAGTARVVVKGPPHCGNAPAAAGREMQPLDRNTEGSGYASADAPYVLIAGSRTDQSSFERPGADGKTRGALTENLIHELLQPAAGKRTYRDVMDRVIPAVLGEFANQIPQLEGRNVNQVVFGDETIETRNYIPVRAASGGKITLAGGRLHGFTPQSQFDIYGPEAHTFEASERPLTRATLDNVEALTSTAGISPVVRIPPGAKAVERQHNFEAQKTRILYAKLNESAALRRLKRALDETPTRAFETVAEGQPFQIRVIEKAGKLHTFGADGMELSQGVALNNPELIPRLEQRALEWTRWFGLLALRNPAAADQVEIKLMPHGNRVASNGIPVFAPGDRPFDVKLKNPTRKKLFAYILDVAGDGSARQVYPDPGSHIPLEPGEETSIGGWSVKVPGTAAYVRDVFKLISATRQVDLTYLQMETPRGREAPTEPPEDPLSRLLFEAAMGVRNSDRHLAVDWSTSEVVFEVCRELDRDGRCRRPSAGR